VGLIYVDACLLIYLVERHSLYASPVREMFLDPAHQGKIAISALVKAECLVGPYKKQDVALVAAFEASFRELNILDILEDDFLAAARLRARSNLKFADALHLACAQRHGCTALWTNDDRLAEASGGLAVGILPVRQL
jgi:uncharacterized protein